VIASTNGDSLRELEGAWRQLAATSGLMPMQEAAWTQSAEEAFRHRRSVEVYVVRRGDELAAVAALVRRRGHLEILGEGELYEPADLLAADGAALDELCQALVRRGLPVLLHRVPADSATIPALKQAIGHRGFVVTLPSRGTPALELDERWAELGGGLSAGRRSDLRRGERRAAAEGGISVRILRPAEPEVDALLDEAFSVEARSWKGAAGTALVHDRPLGTFYRAYASRAASDGKLVVAFLDIGGSAAAMQLAVESRDRLWLMKIGYDEAFARCSPGILLLAHVVSDAARRGLHGIEFLGFSEPWLEPWTTQVRQLRLLVAYPLHPRVLPGMALDAIDTIRRPEIRAAAAGLAVRPVRAVVSRVVSRVAARYVAGPAIEDARRIEGMYAAKGFPTIIGFWDVQAPIDRVVGEYRAAIDALVDRSDAQISIKVPSLGDRAELVTELIGRAMPSRIGVHIDAMAPDQQDAALDIACRLASRADGLLGCTLSGRWLRSMDDAPRVAAAGLRIRVVKSEWPSPDDPDRDPRRGFLDVVAVLCKASPLQVQVATHDAPIADRALRMLLEAGVSCEHQVLHGRKARPAMEVARLLGVPTRIFVGYGTARPPYSLRAALRDPRVAYRLARDLVRRNGGISLS
jgi:CelD/BcsL family acetyltransferase involved in cellulose biosynthesis